MIFKNSRYSSSDVFSAKVSDQDRTLIYFEREQVPFDSSVAHTIAQGETLEILAARYYGDGTKWWLIADANGIFNPLTDLFQGAVITVPAPQVATRSPIG